MKRIQWTQTSTNSYLVKTLRRYITFWKGIKPRDQRIINVDEEQKDFILYAIGQANDRDIMRKAYRFNNYGKARNLLEIATIADNLLEETLKEPYITVNISGFGGEYEEECQKMLKAGMDVLEGLPFDIDNGSFMDIIEEVLLDTSPDCTGAMMGATKGHIWYIYNHSYEEWLSNFGDDRKYLYPDELPPPKFLEEKCGQERKKWL